MKKRLIYQTVINRLSEPRKFIQALLGPRQVGKTTLALQALKELDTPSHYASSDEATLKDSAWLQQQWEIARQKTNKDQTTILVLDEIQKIPHWDNLVKRYWDEDTKKKLPLKVMILGSSPWLMQKGLTESLAGRFEIIHATHWNYTEMKNTFNWDLNQFIYFGGYPGAATLIDSSDSTRWTNYINDSLIETTISRDILLMSPVHKPALLRRLFQLGCHYSSQILSYQKMLGQLQDAGNTTTLAHYIDLLSGAGMLAGLQKFSKQSIRQRASSPKLQVLNTALMSAQVGKTFEQARQDSEYWGHLTESAIGAHLLNSSRGTSIEIFYWREGHQEVDFALQNHDNLTAIEVKSGRTKETLSGMQTFIDRFNPKHVLLIGQKGITIEEFLTQPIEHWIS